ncbi:ankyrin repeat and SOCS box protein 13 [Crotalus adamanteus]|uniref:Ankyrin repeat and SOCS box protein 13 n=1 Tax=Crotalus adamanteus TaxID=8729 RepID=A0AAW1BEW7_CROAD
MNSSTKLQHPFVKKGSWGRNPRSEGCKGRENICKHQHQSHPPGSQVGELRFPAALESSAWAVPGFPTAWPSGLCSPCLRTHGAGGSLLGEIGRSALPRKRKTAVASSESTGGTLAPFGEGSESRGGGKRETEGLCKAFLAERTPVHEVARRGEIHQLQELIWNSACVNLVTYDSITPLHEASLRGETRCVEILLAVGAQVDARNIDGSTPLCDACTSGSIDCNPSEELSSILDSIRIAVPCLQPTFAFLRHQVWPIRGYGLMEPVTAGGSLLGDVHPPPPPQESPPVPGLSLFMLLDLSGALDLRKAQCNFALALLLRKFKGRSGEKRTDASSALVPVLKLRFHN